MRLGIASYVASWFKDQDITSFDPNFLGEDLPKLKKRYGDARTKSYDDWMAIAVAYDFDFEITEQNNVSSALGFSLPFAGGTFDLGASGSLQKMRTGKRTFKATETFGQLLTRDYYAFCKSDPNALASGAIPIGPIPRERNLLYPITGSIGLGKIAETFMAIASQDGGKDSFVDELTFTTTVNGSLNPSVMLSPVPYQLNLVSADAALGAGRVDMHEVTISLAFPVPDPTSFEALTTLSELDKKSGQYTLNPLWRARYNLCLQTGQSREDELKALRYTAPEVYCLDYADAFAPRHSRGGYRPTR